MPALSYGRRTAVEQPYPGLRPFDVDDAFLFFGREQHTQELLDRLSRARFLAVVGTSGSGKSSLVRAGLIPTLFRGYLVGATTRWRVAVMRPGNSPFEELASKLSDSKVLGTDRVALRGKLGASTLGLVEAVKEAGFADGESLLLVIDQFEEIFRFASERRGTEAEGEALQFVTSLLEAADQVQVPIYVVLTMRTDFLGDCTQFPGLPEALNRGQYLIPRLSREQRRDAIEKPTEFAAADIAPPLVQQILNDMGNDPDQLPVMQHALAQMYGLWKERGGTGTLDLDDYRDCGTFASALNQHADRLYYAFPESDREQVRKLFRCLTKIDNGRAVRRPMRIDRIYAVAGADDQRARDTLDRIIGVFSSKKNSLLFVSHGERPEHRIVDIAHESLIRKWERLSKWTKEEAESAQWFSDLARATERQAKKQAGYWSDPALAGVLARKQRDGWTAEWAALYNEGVDYSAVELFLEESRKRQKRENLRKYVLVGLGVIAVVLGLWAIEERRHAEAAEAELASLKAQQTAFNSRIANLENESKRATSDAQRLQIQLQINGEKSALIESLQKENLQLKQSVGEAAKVPTLMKQIEDLRGKLDAAPKYDPAVAAKAQQFDALQKEYGEPGQKLAELTAKAALLDAELKKYRQSRATEQEQKPRPEPQQRAPPEQQQKARPEQQQKASPEQQPQAAPQVLNGHKSSVWSVAFSPDGTRLASAGMDQTVRLWDPWNPKAVPQVLAGHQGLVLSVAFSPDGTRLASASNDGTVRLWDPSSPKAAPRVLFGHRGLVGSVAFSPDGTRLASGSFDRTVRLWDLRQPNTAPQILSGHKGSVESVAFSPDGTRLATGSFDGTVRLWDLRHPNAAAQVFSGHRSYVTSVAFSPDGTRLATGSFDGDVRLWDPWNPKAAPQVLRWIPSFPYSVVFSPDGTRLASARSDNTVQVWDLRQSHSAPQSLSGHEGPVHSVAFSADGTRLASASDDKTVRLWDMRQP